MAASEDDTLDDGGEGQVGWPDGVGDGRPWTVPMSLDYFQGFLVHAGVPAEALPVDGRTLSPEQALRLLPHLLNAEATLGDFARKRMAVHLLLEVATGSEPVSREELHARMDRFHRLRVLRPDGYLVRPITDEAVQKAGEVRLAEDGTLRAGRYEVGPFYAIEDGQLWPVDTGLEVPRNAQPLGPYVPDNGVLLPALEGAGLALVDSVQGLVNTFIHPWDTLEGLARLPGAVRELVQNAPEYWESFRHKPRGEQVRLISRLTTHVLLTVGTAGEGAAAAALWGDKLSRLSMPLLSLTGKGELALQLVAIPGRAVAVAGGALSATYVLHMASVGVAAAGGVSWTPPAGGPGKWIPKNEGMKPRARKYQSQVTKAPPGWVYRVWLGDEYMDFDGYNPQDGFLLDAKGPGYDKWFDENFEYEEYYQGANGLVEAAKRQLQFAQGVPIRWHVAEPRMVDIINKLFEDASIRGITVVYTRPQP
ncbi:Tox-REase-5 domain-containing protein [Vitiosangium sp. GDMCC 1.1324]|uniref:Tox-REase-5 domain-containing protein n=1 Tax=Vitiosangium sp. (strain GDMCC 1.1324) TaxID=2138576 RepID=UPI00130E1C35|nr:Tox-REase-5 domain-containing protein [Vitiosangium sp. GDMCC 1.1324]